MSSEHETDVYYFKKVYRYWTEGGGFKMAAIVRESGLQAPMVKKLINCNKSSIPNMYASSWGLLQDYVKKYKVHISELDYVGEYAEGIEHIISENGKGKSVEDTAALPLTIGEADAFDLLRALSKVSNVSLNIGITMSAK